MTPNTTITVIIPRSSSNATTELAQFSASACTSNDGGPLGRL